MYYMPEPPYFLLIFGLFAGITCGLAFEATLKKKVQSWSKRGSQPVRGLELQLPFLGIVIGICVFLSSGLEIFLMDRWLAYEISFPITIFIAALVWVQLEKLLKQLEEGGSKAIDLDAW